MEFRKARPDDLSGIMCVMKQARAFIAAQHIDQWQDGYPEEDIITTDIALGRGYVLCGGEEVFGYVVLLFDAEPTYARIDNGPGWQYDEPYCTIHRIAVCDARRGSGLGGRILAEAESAAKMRGISCIRVDTHRGNLVMRAFLTRHGFELRGEIRVNVKSGDPVRVAFEKKLLKD